MRSRANRTARDRLDVLLQHCVDLGVEVEWCNLGERQRGEYRDDRRLIVLHPVLTRRQCTATLAHEVGHAEFGDRCSTPAVERRAWEFGASLVISSRDYERAEALVGPHPAALAIELEVTPKLIEAWRRWWLKRGQRAGVRERP